MKLFTTLLLICCSLYSQARNSVFTQLCDVNRCWQEQKDINERLLPATMPADDREQIRLHLLLVERILRHRDNNHLSVAQKNNREHALDQLHQYWLAGRFPINDEYAYRTPIFIDKYDNFCAVGYLVKATGHEHVSRMIAAETNLAYVHEMNYPELMAWANDFGFTKDELAWIQPGYPPLQFAASVGKGTDGAVYELYADDTAGRLYVGGSFTRADKVLDVKNIAYVTESNGVFTWHTMNGGPQGPVYAIAGFDNKIFAGGDFKMATGTMATGIAYWDGNSWHGISPSCLDGIVKDLTVYHGKLYAAGSFTVGSATACLAQWTGYCWTPYTGISGMANTMEVFNDQLVLGGKFNYGGSSVNAIRWDDVSFSFQPFNNSVVSEVNDFEVYKGQLFAACSPVANEPQLVNKLQNNTWAPDTNQVDNWDTFSLHTLLAYDDTLMVGGKFYGGFNPYFSNCATIRPKPIFQWGPKNDNFFIVDSAIYKFVKFKDYIIAGGAFETGNAYDFYHEGPTPLNSMARKSSCYNVVASHETAVDKPAQKITCRYTGHSYSYLSDSVQWDFGDGETIIKYGADTVVTHTYKNPGKYYVCVTAFGSCGKDKSCDSVDLLLITGVQEHTLNGVKLYPNPAKDHFTVDGATKGTKAVLYDLAGRMVQEWLLQKEQAVLDVRALSSGNYLLVLTAPDGKRQTVKLGKE